jgi:hypothetical protein
MEYLKRLVNILVRYRIEIQAVEIFEDCIRLTSENGTVLSLPYDILDTSKEGIARLVLFAFDPDRAASSYWKYHDWYTLEEESNLN